MPDPAGLRLRKAFNHFVFIDDEDDEDIFLSPPGLGEPGSSLLKKSSFCKDKEKSTSKMRFLFAPKRPVEDNLSIPHSAQDCVAIILLPFTIKKARIYAQEK